MTLSQVGTFSKIPKNFQAGTIIPRMVSSLEKFPPLKLFPHPSEETIQEFIIREKMMPKLYQIFKDLEVQKE